jgi:hypothetical protein
VDDLWNIKMRLLGMSRGDAQVSRTN